MKAPLKNKIWGVYNKQMLWLSFAVKVFGFSWTNGKVRFNNGEFCPLVEEGENYSPFCAESLLKRQNFQKAGSREIRVRETIWKWLCNVLKQIHQTFPTKFSKSWNDHCVSSKKTSVVCMTQVVSLGDIYCKVSMLICLRSSSSLMRLGLGRWGEARVPGEGEEMGDSLKGFGGPLRAPWKSQLPQHLREPQDANLFSTILSLKSLNMEEEGEVATNWIICARV